MDRTPHTRYIVTNTTTVESSGTINTDEFSCEISKKRSAAVSTKAQVCKKPRQNASTQLMMQLNSFILKNQDLYLQMQKCIIMCIYLITIIIYSIGCWGREFT